MRRLRGVWPRGGGGLALGVGPWLPALLVLGAGLSPAVYPDEFPLFPTLGNEGASGMVYLRQPWSPFGVSVDEDGRVRYDVTVHVRGLPASAAETYHVWLTTPTLERVVDLGSVDGAGQVGGETSWEQLIVVVSREPAERIVAEGERWSGLVVLRGFSAGARVTPLAQHSLFQQTPM